MNLLESELHYPLGDRLPGVGESIEVAPGVRWVRMALPFALNHINLWLLRDRIDGREGWTVVDCCIARDESRAQWEQIFATQLDGLPILRVIVTHMHPDHIGLADWLCKRWDAPLWISATDYHVARVLVQAGDTLAGGGPAADFFAAHGLADEKTLSAIRNRTSYFTTLVPAVPERFVRMMDGDTVRIGDHDWRCISGYGHAPEHISLYCDSLAWQGADDSSGRGVLLGGDMMLPRISTNVSVHAGEPEANSLQLFLDSLLRFLPLPTDTLGLPAHGKPFVGIHRRVEQLQEHHAERLADLLAACAKNPTNAAEALPLLFTRALDVHQMTFAMGESVAHLHYLWFSGQVQRQRDAHGVWRFSTSASSVA